MAAGATGVSAVNSDNVSRAETSKPWHVDLTVRGMYDSNPYSKPSAIPGGRDSFGMEVRPELRIAHTEGPARYAARYYYGARYWERYDITDQTHVLDASLNYETDKYSFGVAESFAYSDQPLILEAVGPLATYSVNGTGIRNDVRVDGGYQLTRENALKADFENTIYDYRDAGYAGSRSALLDRYENTFNVTYLHTLLPDWNAKAGYQFGMVDFTGNDQLSVGGPSSFSRNSRSHYLYVGADHVVSSKMRVGGRLGAMYTQYPSFSEMGDWSPYGELDAKYTYLPGSTVSLQLQHRVSVTDMVGGVDAQGTPTLSQESTALLLNVSHSINPGFRATLGSQFQFSTFNGGTYGNQGENWVYVSPGLEYDFKIGAVRLTAQTGYGYQFLTSDAGGRDYDRHNIYLGLKGTY